MNLDEQLRAALSLEADMQNATRPDIDGLITGGRARRRRRNVLWASGAALAVVLIGGGAYAVTQLDLSDAGSSPIVGEPTSEANPAALPGDAGEDQLEPGTYRVLVGADATGDGEIEADLTLEGSGWKAGNFPTVQEGVTYGGIAVYRPDALAVESGCNHDVSNDRVGETPQALAEQLAGSRGARSSSQSGPRRSSATTPSTYGSGSPTTAPMAGATASRRRHEAVAASASAACPRRSSWTSGSWTWTECRSWSTPGTRTARRPPWWTGSPRPSDSISFVAG